jgi:hypothetical protein
MEKVKMPEAVKVEVGCKVAFYYYASEAEARIAGAVFKQEAVVQASKGYDFGYQVPGYGGEVKGRGLWYAVSP